MGKGHLTHNNREFISNNVVPERTAWNRIYIQESLEQAYEKCFGQALMEYNAGQKRKADIVVIDMPLLDTRREKNLLGTFISDVVLALLSYVAENERTNIKQRQAEGIAAAKARGVKFGRPPLPIPQNFYQMHKDWRAGKITIEEAAKACNMCPKTFYSKAVKYEKSS